MFFFFFLLLNCPTQIQLSHCDTSWITLPSSTKLDNYLTSKVFWWNFCRRTVILLLQATLQYSCCRLGPKTFDSHTWTTCLFILAVWFSYFPATSLHLVFHHVFSSSPGLSSYDLIYFLYAIKCISPYICLFLWNLWKFLLWSFYDWF